MLIKYLGKLDIEILSFISQEQRQPKIKQKEISDRKRKTFDHLARKGFDFEVINEIIRDNIY